MRVTSGVAGTIFATMLVAALLLVFQADAIAAPPPDLTVGEGQTVTIGPGPLEYGEVTIATGGLLQFTGSVSLTCLRLVLRGVIQIGGDASILCTHQESEPEASGPAVLFDAGIIRSDTSALHPTATNGTNGAAATIPGGSGQDGGSGAAGVSGYRLSLTAHGDIHFKGGSRIVVPGQHGGSGGQGGDAYPGAEGECSQGGTGGNGGDGGSGGSGGDGGAVTITAVNGSLDYYQPLVNSYARLEVNADGGNGGDGGNAREGGRGGSGYKTGSCPDVCARGGTGGEGGYGAPGGRGGNGGRLVISALRINKVSNADDAAWRLAGGRGGSGGSGGNGGEYGPSEITSVACSSIGGPARQGAPAAVGGDGGFVYVRLKDTLYSGFSGIPASPAVPLFILAPGGEGGEAGGVGNPGTMVIDCGATEQPLTPLNNAGRGGKGGRIVIVASQADTVHLEVPGGRGGSGSDGANIAYRGCYYATPGDGGDGAAGGNGGLIILAAMPATWDELLLAGGAGGYVGPGGVNEAGGPAVGSDGNVGPAGGSGILRFSQANIGGLVPLLFAP
jgi:hypothetical protein